MTSDFHERRTALRHVLGWGSLLLTGCGGGGSDNGTGQTDRGPLISAQPQGLTVKSGRTATFSVTASGTGSLGYQWLRDGTAIAGATAASLTTGTLSYADNGAVYTVVVSNSTGQVTSAAALLTVTPRIIAVEATYYASYGLLEDGTLWGWGSVSLLGVGSASVSAGTAAKALLSDGSTLGGISRACGGEGEMFVVRSDGSLWGWGLNSDGELGDGSQVQRLNPVAVVASDGGTLSAIQGAANATEHTLALASDGRIWAWGGNTYGQLGNGISGADSVAESLVPVQVLRAAATPLSGITQVSAGGLGSAALDDAATVWAWGNGSDGMLGNGGTSDSAYAVQVETAAGVALSGVRAIACGYSHRLALASDGTVWAWGAGNTGALGNGTRVDSTRATQVTDSSGAAFGDVTAIAGGHGFSVLLRSDGSVWTCGQNASGALGIGLSTTTGTASLRLNPVQVITSDGSALTGITAVQAHHFHVVALASDGTPWTWGYNAYGQVGDGSTTLRTSAFALDGL